MQSIIITHLQCRSEVCESLHAHSVHVLFVHHQRLLLLVLIAGTCRHLTFIVDQVKFDCKCKCMMRCVRLFLRMLYCNCLNVLFSCGVSPENMSWMIWKLFSGRLSERNCSVIVWCVLLAQITIKFEYAESLGLPTMSV